MLGFSKIEVRKPSGESVNFLIKHRVVFAFLLTPAIFASVVGFESMSEGKGFFVEDAFFVFFLLLVVSTIVALPLFLVLRAVNWLRWYHAVAVGALCGGIPCLMIGIDPRGAFAAAAVGSAVGLLFWFLALYRNPRYSHKQQEST